MKFLLSAVVTAVKFPLCLQKDKKKKNLSIKQELYAHKGGLSNVKPYVLPSFWHHLELMCSRMVRVVILPQRRNARDDAVDESKRC